MSLSEKYTQSVLLRFILRVFSFGSTIAYLFVIARVTTLPTFALVGFLTVIRGILPRITRFGIPYYIVNRASKFIVEGNGGLTRKSYLGSLKLSLLLRIPLVLFLTSIMLFLRGGIQGQLLIAVGMGTFFLSYILFQFFRSWLRAFLKVKASLLLSSVPSILSSFLSLALYLLLHNVLAIVIGWTIPYFIAGIIAFAMTRRFLPEKKREGNTEANSVPNEQVTWKKILRAGSSMYLFALVSLLFGKLDRLFSAFLLQPHIFALYYAVFRIAAGIFKTGSTIKGQILSVFSHLRHKDPSKIESAYSLVFKVMFLFAIGSVFIAALFPGLLISLLLGGKYLSPLGITVLLILLAGTFFRLLVPLFKSIRKVTGKLKKLILVEVISLGIKGTLIWLLFPYGGVGIAIVFLSTLVFQAVILGFMSRRWLKINPNVILKAIIALLPVVVIRMISMYFLPVFPIVKAGLMGACALSYVLMISALKPLKKEEVAKIKRSSPSLIKKLVSVLFERGE